MDVAEMIVEDFLYQNAFTKHDFKCPLSKSVSITGTVTFLIQRKIYRFFFSFTAVCLNLFFAKYFTALSRQIGMLKCIIAFYENSQRAIAESSADKKITWAYIKTTLAHVIDKVKATKFEVSWCLYGSWHVGSKQIKYAYNHMLSIAHTFTRSYY